MYHYQGQQLSNYGAMPAPNNVDRYGLEGAKFRGLGPTVVKPPAVQWFRRRLNVVAMCVCLFVPWLLFCFTSWSISFILHFWWPGVTYVLAFLGLTFVLFLGSLAWKAWKAERTGDPSYEPTWFIFLFLTSLLAWTMAVYIGSNNFYYHMNAFYGISNMRAYKGVNPTLAHGQQLMDAGLIQFTPGSHIDFDRAMSFQNKDTYCVAPIVQANSSLHGPPASYDFWAVGINCCCSDAVRASNFQCGAYDNPKANGVVRLMHDQHRDFYRLAVQQAVGSFAIKAEHPLFFHWVQEPAAVLDAYRWEGQRQFLLWMYLHFLLQIIMVGIAACMFNRTDPIAHPIASNP